MTNREIAQKLKISPASLSLILNNKPGVSDSTRTKIITQLNEMGFGYLIKKITTAVQNNNIGFVIYKKHGAILDISPFFLVLMEFIEIHARSYGYNILLSTIDERRSLKPQIDHISELNLKGAIIFATEMNDENMKGFKNLQIPIVAIDNDFSRLSCNTVSINNIMGTFQAIEHLVKMNHYRIGYLKSNIRISSFEERKKGYESALEYFNLTFSSSNILEVRHTEEGSYQDIKGFLEINKSTKLPSAFVCDDDTIAVGALRAFTEYGYKIPEDISIIGFNDRSICEVTSPPLTTISIPKRTFAFEAVDELIHLIHNKDKSLEVSLSRKIRIETKLIERKSVKLV